MATDSNLDELARSVASGDRGALSRAITLVESSKPEDATRALELLRILGAERKSFCIGITGTPGAGKSTLVDALGAEILQAPNRSGAPHRVAVLAIDPSSQRTGGSILGDKTRMQRLSNAGAFIRPSPSRGVLGGVGSRTREALSLCEAAGFDLVLIETVGTGQAEQSVAEVADVVVNVMLSGAGDDLQGIKRGVLEVSDLVVFNKADVDPERARSSALEHERALALLRPHDSPKVLLVSAETGSGVPELWATLESSYEALRKSGRLETRRAEQRVLWFRRALEERLVQLFFLEQEVGTHLAELESRLGKNELSPIQAVDELFRIKSGGA